MQMRIAASYLSESIAANKGHAGCFKVSDVLSVPQK